MITCHDKAEAYRKRAGLSYEQLAARAETSTSFIYRICQGKAKPGRNMLLRLGLAMNLSVMETDELLRSACYLGLLDDRSAAHS